MLNKVDIYSLNLHATPMQKTPIFTSSLKGWWPSEDKSLHTRTTMKEIMDMGDGGDVLVIVC